MTYSSLRRYEFTAFTLADLQSAGLSGSLSAGDCFKMPPAATACISVVDNDSALSGDRYCDDRSEDSSYQNATITRGSAGLGNGGQIYAEQVMKLWGSDGKAYWLVEIEQENSKAGDLFTFYGDVPPAGTILRALCSYDVPSCGIDFRCLDGGPKEPVNTPPEFTNAPKDCIEIDEGSQTVFDLDAKDLDGDTLTYSITGGADKDRFVIDAQTGVISFVAPPDYESPADAGGDNLYNLTVTVSDGKGGTAVKALCVKVNDVVENVPGDCIIIEAEDMWLCGYKVECDSSASGDRLVKLTSNVGYAVTAFTGETGTYDMKLFVVDENDGRGGFKVYVGNKLVDVIYLSEDTDNGRGNTEFREIVIEDVAFKAGDKITIVGYGSCNEYARIDKIQICSDEPKPAALGDYVWFDADKDGIQDAGEEGVAGITVNLLGSNGAVIATDTTDANGLYFFDGLAAGDYRVEFVLPGDGRVFTQANAGTDDAADSDADAATGRSQTVTLSAGETDRTIDAGLVDPGTAALGDRVWFDINRNGVQNAGEPGASGVAVALLNAAGAVLATTTTDGQGEYLFSGLDAGDYRVRFDEVDGFDFTGQDLGASDAADSDADTATGESHAISLAIGETNLTLDAGLVRENTDPTADDDSGKVCATESVAIDVLDGDSDADADPLTIVAIDGQAIAVGGSVTLASGAKVTLNADGTLSYDSAGATYNGVAAADLPIGSKASDLFSYSVDDGQGGSAGANVDVSICGATNTLETIDASLPANVTFQLAGFSKPQFVNAYTLTISGSGDPRLDGKTFEAAYCLDSETDSTTRVPIQAEVFVADPEAYTGDDLTTEALGNLDLINWILNQDFGSIDNDDGTATNYTDWEIQTAIWELTNDVITPLGTDRRWGTVDNALEIADLARANGEGFELGEGDVLGLIIDPLDNQPDGVLQPFIIAIPFDSLAQECIC